MTPLTTDAVPLSVLALDKLPAGVHVRLSSNRRTIVACTNGDCSTPGREPRNLLAAESKNTEVELQPTWCGCVRRGGHPTDATTDEAVRRAGHLASTMVCQDSPSHYRPGVLASTIENLTAEYYAPRLARVARWVAPASVFSVWQDSTDTRLGPWLAEVCSRFSGLNVLALLEQERAGAGKASGLLDHVGEFPTEPRTGKDAWVVFDDEGRPWSQASQHSREAGTAAAITLAARTAVRVPEQQMVTCLVPARVAAQVPQLTTFAALDADDDRIVQLISTVCVEATEPVSAYELATAVRAAAGP